MKPMKLFFLSMTALCLLLSQMARSEESERADRVLFNENFEETSGVIIKFVFCFTAFFISAVVLFKLF